MATRKTSAKKKLTPNPDGRFTHVSVDDSKDQRQMIAKGEVFETTATHAKELLEQTFRGEPVWVVAK